eukprot:7712854-Lingulodinium_polyedra.AAC.1
MRGGPLPALHFAGRRRMPAHGLRRAQQGARSRDHAPQGVRVATRTQQAQECPPVPERAAAAGHRKAW